MDGAIKEGDHPQMGLARRRWLERIGRRGSAAERRIWMGERNAWGKRMDGVITGFVYLLSRLFPARPEAVEDDGLPARRVGNYYLIETTNAARPDPRIREHNLMWLEDEKRRERASLVTDWRKEEQYRSDFEDFLSRGRGE
jgi:hypothetical protein